jgi:hypothetical protein
MITEEYPVKQPMIFRRKNFEVQYIEWPKSIGGTFELKFRTYRGWDAGRTFVFSFNHRMLWVRVGNKLRKQQSNRTFQSSKEF